MIFLFCFALKNEPHHILTANHAQSTAWNGLSLNHFKEAQFAFTFWSIHVCVQVHMTLLCPFLCNRLNGCKQAKHMGLMKLDMSQIQGFAYVSATVVERHKNTLLPIPHRPHKLELHSPVIKTATLQLKNAFFWLGRLLMRGIHLSIASNVG